MRVSGRQRAAIYFSGRVGADYFLLHSGGNDFPKQIWTAESGSIIKLPIGAQTPDRMMSRSFSEHIELQLACLGGARGRPHQRIGWAIQRLVHTGRPYLPAPLTIHVRPAVGGILPRRYGSKKRSHGQAHSLHSQRDTLEPCTDDTIS